MNLTTALQVALAVQLSLLISNIQHTVVWYGMVW